jgi:hypothetical protein
MQSYWLLKQVVHALSNSHVEDLSSQQYGKTCNVVLLEHSVEQCVICLRYFVPGVENVSDVAPRVLAFYVGR